MARSLDGGDTWTKPQPWQYDDGSSFFSPSACSQLLAHSNGKLYWIGNISTQNPRGNRPRYPLVLGEVDQDTGCLRRTSITRIDDRRQDESELLTLSNFHAREDRETNNLIVLLPRFFAAGQQGEDRFTADLEQITIRL